MPQQALYLDVAGGGLQFSNLDVGQFPVYASMTMLAVDFVLYGLLAVYFDNVIPSKWTMSEGWVHACNLGEKILEFFVSACVCEILQTSSQ